MVTPIYPNRKERLYLREHRKAKGMSAERVASRLGIVRESLLRLEREPSRVNEEKQAAFAAAIGIEPADLWRPPDIPPPRPAVDLNKIVENEPDDTKEWAADMLRRMLSGRR